MEIYKHKVQYYETDKMGVTHHSNYIRWMEEARIDYLAQLGFSYLALEKSGIASPVVEVNCKYKAPTTFQDEIYIRVTIEEFNGVKLKLQYEMKKQDGKKVCEGKSTHCFLDKTGKPIRLSNNSPELSKILREEAKKENKPKQ